MVLGWLKRRGRQQQQPRQKRIAPRLEQLEDRLTPVTGVTNLTQGLTPQDLVQSLVGVGVQISNVTYTGANAAAGTFTGGQNTIGFGTGVILSSGLAAGVVGTAGNLASTTNGTPGDPDLTAIVSTQNPTQTFDAAVLEFDFVPQGSLLSFQYVFGSEEYPEFVNFGVNDVFAFFLNGKNIALIPGTQTPVSIDTVNAGVNSQFYVDNTGGAFTIILDAFTKVLTIKAKVNAGVSNHIKLAISDSGDSILDSDVFIKAGSFSAAKEPIIKVFNPLRYSFNPFTRVYRGVMTLINIGNEIQPGPVYIVFRKLPQGVSIMNATGETSDGKPYMRINKSIGINKAVRLAIKLTNPLRSTLSPFYLSKGIKFTAVDPAE